MKPMCVCFSLLITVSLLLSACGPAPTPVPPTVAGPTGAKYPVGTNAFAYDPNKPVNDGKPITLTIWDGDSKYTKYFKQYQALYSAYHPNVTFENTSTPWDAYWQKLPLALGAGQGPDLFHFHSDYTVQFVESGWIAPYPAEWIPLLEQDFIGVEKHVIEGNLYYTDNGLMTGSILYNKDMWEAAGLTDNDIPKNWAEFTAVAKKLTKVEGDKTVVEGFAINGNTPGYLFQALKYQAGGYLFAANGKTVIAGESAKKAVQQLYDWYYTDKISDITFPSSGESFGTGKAAMTYQWGWFANVMKNTYPSIKYGVFALPTFTGQIAPAVDRTNGDATLGVNAAVSAERKAVAFDFVHFLIDNEDANIQAALMTNQAPVMKRIMDRPELVDNVITKVAAAYIDHTIWPGPIPPNFDSINLATIADGLKANQSVNDIVKAWETKQNENLAAQTKAWWIYERNYAFDDLMTEK